MTVQVIYSALVFMKVLQHFGTSSGSFCSFLAGRAQDPSPQKTLMDGLKTQRKQARRAHETASRMWLEHQRAVPSTSEQEEEEAATTREIERLRQQLGLPVYTPLPSFLSLEEQACSLCLTIPQSIRYMY